jgi:acyl-coenzyme A synthetase/AMP-(fatty) acid ligase
MVKPGEILTRGDVQSHVGERLARFKVPAHVRIVEEHLPRTGSGKIYKAAARQALLAETDDAGVPA